MTAGCSSAAIPASTTSWVYHDGEFLWAGDYSFEATIDYSDTSGVPLTGACDIKVTLTSANGAFQPYVNAAGNFDTTPYNYLQFSLKPTSAAMAAQMYFAFTGDTYNNIFVNPFQAKYGPTPVAGQWGTYKIPLSDFGVANMHIYKFAIQDQTGGSGDVFYVDEIAFVP